MTHWTDTFSTRLSHRRAHGRYETVVGRKTSGLAGIVVRVINLLFSWQERANSRYQLAQLDDRMLKDIGISRVDALYEAAKPFWRP